MFHEEIKSATDAAHREAETSEFIQRLMAGDLNQSSYLSYLHALYPIYLQMENLLKKRKASPLLQHFDHRALDRSESIARDIAYLEETLGLVANPTLTSVTAYLNRLTDGISDARLLAHHYLRYLGDLSGGQAIARLVQRHYQLPADGLNFYDFSLIGDNVFYKNRYRDLLNLVPFTEFDKREFLDEATILYKLTRDIFEELDSKEALLS
ncbi:MAG: putative heme oxygenase [Actinomycetota bacterium]|jgi:heme oxygenase